MSCYCCRGKVRCTEVEMKSEHTVVGLIVEISCCNPECSNTKLVDLDKFEAGTTFRCAECADVKMYWCPSEHQYTYKPYVYPPDSEEVDYGPGCEECIACDMADAECDWKAAGFW
jgi:hypothetical protein